MSAFVGSNSQSQAYLPPAFSAPATTASAKTGRIRAFFTPRRIALSIALIAGWLAAAFQFPLPP